MKRNQNIALAVLVCALIAVFVFLAVREYEQEKTPAENIEEAVDRAGDEMEERLDEFGDKIEDVTD